MEDTRKLKDEFYSESLLTQMYDEGKIYFFDVIQNYTYRLLNHEGYSTEFYADLNECVKEAYNCIVSNGLNSLSQVRCIRIYGLTNEKDYDGNRLYLKICDISYAYIRKYNETYVSFNKDTLRSDDYEIYFPHISQVVENKNLSDGDLNVLEKQNVKKRVYKNDQQSS